MGDYDGLSVGRYRQTMRYRLPHFSRAIILLVICPLLLCACGHSPESPGGSPPPAPDQGTPGPGMALPADGPNDDAPPEPPPGPPPAGDATGDVPSGPPPSTPEPAATPTPTPPKTYPKLMNLSKKEAQNLTCIYGFNVQDEMQDWIRELGAMLLDDIKWGLEEKTPDLSKMTKIPAGEMDFGCDPLGLDDTLSCIAMQKLSVPQFYIDKNEVTNAEYHECVKAEKCLPLLRQPHIADAGKDKMPALMTFKQAERYCYWAGKELPTEPQWEMAARGSDGRLYPWGNDEPDDTRGNICGKGCNFQWADENWNDGYDYTSPVGSFPKGKSPFGLSDMEGNVKEWVKSYTTLEKNHYIARGASWYSPTREMMVHYRQDWVPGTRVDDKGVRCVAGAQ